MRARLKMQLHCGVSGKMVVALRIIVEVLVFLGILSSAAGHRKGLRVSLDLRHQYAITLLDFPWQFLAGQVL